MATPAEDGFFMPADWRVHERCWMAWPCRAELWGERLDAARDATAEVARAVATFEPVTMLVKPDDLAEASLKCGSGIACLPFELDDSWLRDTGPSFVVDDRGGLAGIDWRFNGWGERYQPYDTDAALAGALLGHLDLARFAAPIVLEGGAIHVDGEGTLLTTEQCLLNPNRNGGMSRSEIEEVLRAYLGVRKVVWLGQGLEDDETDGHVDNLACFVRPGMVLALTTADREDGNHAALADNLERLRAATDARGRAFEIVEVAQPGPGAAEDGRRLAKSYVNLYIANGGVVLPSFEDSKDGDAYDAVSKCFPDRKITQIPAGDIVHGGGGIHCITQQQPARTVEAADEPDPEDAAA